MHDVLSRWLSPLTKYRRYISEDTEPFYADEEIAVLGVNTARSNVIKGGRINREQVARSCARFEGAGKDITRIIVTHHPFDLPQSEAGGALVGRADMAMAGFAGCRVDLILSGHMHVSHQSASATRYPIPGYSAIMVQAGTATSSRRRGELKRLQHHPHRAPENRDRYPDMGRRRRRFRPVEHGSFSIRTRGMVAHCR